MQKPEIPNSRHFELQMVVLIQLMSPESGQSTATGFGRLVKGIFPKKVHFCPGRMCQFLRLQNSISVQKQKIHDGHVFGEIIGVWFWNGCHSTCHVHHPEKRHVVSCEVLKVLQYCWNLGPNLVFWKSKQLVFFFAIITSHRWWLNVYVFILKILENIFLFFIMHVMRFKWYVGWDCYLGWLHLNSVGFWKIWFFVGAQLGGSVLRKCTAGKTILQDVVHSQQLGKIYNNLWYSKHQWIAIIPPSLFEITVLSWGPFSSPCRGSQRGNRGPLSVYQLIWSIYSDQTAIWSPQMVLQ